jgi:type IV pilus assembly protein PilQ
MILSLILATLLAQSTVSFNLRDVDLRDFLMTMGQMANMNVVVHPAVQGKITLNVHDVAWDVLLDTVLKNYSLGREAQGNIIRIVPTSVIAQEYRQQAALEEARLNALPLVTRTYALNYAKAADMVPILSKFLSPRGSIVADPRRNVLIITDVASSVARIVP